MLKYAARQENCCWCDCCFRNSGANHPTITGFDHHGRPTWPLCRGYVSAAFLPGLVLTLMYAGYIFLVSISLASMGPCLVNGRRGHLREANGDSGVLSLFITHHRQQCSSLCFFALYYKARSRERRSRTIDRLFRYRLALASAFIFALINRWFKVGLPVTHG